jgi:2,4-dienoyl-CoA reductase-like NADH-dependent reductase (Old Yellow Enzyme family)
MASLFEPGRIGPVEVPNRIVLAPMTTRAADREGFVTAQTIAYYSARARGGVGLLTVEMASPERCGRHRQHELGIFDDRFLPGLTRLAGAIHAAGAKACIQLGHAGGHTRPDICGEQPIAPSAIPHLVEEVTTETIIPEAMSKERIEETTACFVAAARRAGAAGFDCVEIHAAHGYLISQFHTPFENRRTDEYGGSLENRARFGLELTRRVKAAVAGLGVIYRLTVDDFFPEGLQLEEGLTIAQWAGQSGADALHIAAGHYRSRRRTPGMIPPMAWPAAPFLGFARALRPRVSLPVIAVGRLGDPTTAEAALRAGACDFVALGRALLADAEWPRKVKTGVPIRCCLACNTCISGMRSGGALHCLVNAETGREAALAERSLPHGKRIAVVGAGPAGLTFASLVGAANDVVVFEREAWPGGSLRYAGWAPRFQGVEVSRVSLARYVAGLEAASAHAGVRLRYGVDVAKHPELLVGFDQVVVASGAAYRLGLGGLARALLRGGVARWPGVRRLFAQRWLLDFLYYRARRSTGAVITGLVKPGTPVVMIGDAAAPGKVAGAIESAFAAAWGGGTVSLPAAAPATVAAAPSQASNAASPRP